MTHDRISISRGLCELLAGLDEYSRRNTKLLNGVRFRVEPVERSAKLCPHYISQPPTQPSTCDVIPC